MPLAREFNEAVAMDLKVWDFKKNIYFLHLIDMATRFSISTVIYEKEKQVIMYRILLPNPFSNGLCERNHAVIDEMVHKMIEDQSDCSLEIALSWAVHAKHSSNGGRF